MIRLVLIKISRGRAPPYSQDAKPAPAIRALEQVDRLICSRISSVINILIFYFFFASLMFFLPPQLPGPPLNTHVELYEKLVTVIDADISKKLSHPLTFLHVVCYSPYTDFCHPAFNALRRRWSTNNRVGNTLFFFTFSLSSFFSWWSNAF